MKINTMVLSGVCLVFFALNSMEERPSIQSIKQNPEVEQREEKFVRLNLLNDEGESLYSIRVPALFARESSVIHNNLQFQEEEEEGVEPSVSLPVSNMSIGRLKLLEELLSHNYQQEKRKAILTLVGNLYAQKQLSKLPILISIADYIGNEDLLRRGVKVLFRVLNRIAQNKNWALFFHLISGIKQIELQEKLSKKIRKLPLINAVMNKFYRIKYTKFLKFEYYSSQCDIAVGKDSWLAALLFSHRNDSSTIAIIDLQAGKLVTSFQTKESVYGDIKISPLGDLVMVGGIYGKYGKTDIYSIKTGQYIAELPLDKVDSFCFSKDGALIVATGDEKVSVYNSNTLELEQQFQIGSTLAQWLTMSPDQQLIAFLGSQEHIEIWDLQQQKKINEIVEKIENWHPIIKPLSFSPKNNYLAYGLSSGRVKIVTALNGTTIADLQLVDKEHRNLLPSFAFSPNNTLLATGFRHSFDNPLREREVQVWDLRIKKVIRKNKSDFKDIEAISFSRDGDTMVFIAKNFADVALYKTDMYNEKLKEISLEPLALLWYFSMQLQDNQPFIVPKNYGSAFHDLPIEIKNFFNEQNKKRGGPTVPEEQKEAPIKSSGEKRKEPSQGESKNPKQNLRPFKRERKD